MPAWKKLITSGSDASLKSLNVSSGVTGSLFGTASWATNVVNNGVTSVGGTGTVSGLTLSGTVTSTGNLTLGGTLSGITNSNLSGTAGITNANLANSSITIGSTAVSLGSTATTIAGLTSVTSTTFVGALTGTSSWATNVVNTASNATAAATVNVTLDNATNASYYPVFTSGISGNQVARVDNATLTYNPGTNTLTTTNFAGTATTATNATNVTATTSATNSYFKIPFINHTGNTTGNYGLLQDSDSGTFTYNPNDNQIRVTTISGSSVNLNGGHALFNYIGVCILTAASGTTIELGGGPGNVQNNVNVKNGTLAIGTTSVQGRFHVNQTSTLGGTTGNNLILQTLQNSGGSGGNTVYVKDYAVRDATGTDWLTWRHHNSIDIDGIYNTPGTNTRCFWERDPFAGIHYFGSSAMTALVVNGATNTIIANNIEVQENAAGIYNDGGDLAVGDWNGNGYGTSLYGPGGNQVFQTNTGFLKFQQPIAHNSAIGTASVTGEVVYFGGGSVTAGDLYYYDSSGNWTAANASAASTATNMLGIAQATGTASTVGMLLRGHARFTGNTNYTGVTTVGAPLYIKTTAGGFSQTAPNASTHIVRIIGYVQNTSNDQIYFCPDTTWVELA
jgi:hypothetical protein